MGTVFIEYTSTAPDTGERRPQGRIDPQSLAACYRAYTALDRIFTQGSCTWTQSVWNLRLLGERLLTRLVLNVSNDVFVSNGWTFADG